MSNFPAVLEDRQQNLSALVILLLAGAMAASVRQWWSLSGFLLALSTVKPQLSWLLIAWMLLFAASDWKQRGRLVWSFWLSLGGLLLAATAFSPHWMRGFWAAARAYRSYAMGPSIFRILLPPVLSTAAIAVLGAFAGIVVWKWRKLEPASTQFAWTIALLSALTVALTTQAAHYQILLLPALLVLASSVDVVRIRSFLIRTLAKAVWACLLWQWCAASILALCSAFESASSLRGAAELPIYTLLALPILTLSVVVGTILAMQLAGRVRTDSAHNASSIHALP